MAMVKIAPIDGSETVWESKDICSKFLSIIIHKVGKNAPERKTYRIPFTWTVRNGSKVSMATGYGRTYKQALVRAEKARNYILENSVRQFKTPEHISDKWENMVAD